MNMNSSRHRTHRPAVCTLLVGVLLFASWISAARAEGNPLGTLEGMCRRLAVGILADLKPAEVAQAQAAASSGGAAEIEALVRTHDRTVAQLERLALQAEEDFGRAALTADDPRRAAAIASLEKIRKYRRIVAERYARLVDLVGLTPKPHWRETLRGTVRVGIGSNTAAVEQVGGQTTETDVTRSDIAVDLTTELTPADRLALALGRSEEIRFAPAARSRAALDYTRTLAPHARVGTRFGWEGYRNDANDLADLNRTEFALYGSAEPSHLLKGSARFALLSGAYPNASDADYRDQQFTLSATSSPSTSFDGGVTYAHTAHDMQAAAAAGDHTRDHIAGRLRFKVGDRAHLALSGHLLTCAFDDTAQAGDYTRRGIKIMHRVQGSAGEMHSMWFEFRSKEHDGAEVLDFRDLRGGFQSHHLAGGQGAQRTSLMATYRAYAEETNLDYIECRYDGDYARRRGVFWETSTYGRYFIKRDSTERNAELNIYGWLGMAFGEEIQLKIGPHLAANTELVLVDGTVDAQGEEVGLLESPNSTARYGVKGTAHIQTRKLKLRASGRYEILNAYNLDDAPKPTRFEFEGDAAYRIHALFDANVELQYFATGADEVGAIKTSEFDILLGATYHLGGR